MKKTILKLLLFIFISAVWGKSIYAEDKISVFVSIVPQKFFVEKIAKDFVDVQVMVKPGASPRTYEPKPQQMIELAGAKAYFAIGVSFEKIWLEKIRNTNPNMLVVETHGNIQKVPMKNHHHHHHHGTPEKLDPHVWTCPALVMVQARAIFNTLREIDPERAQEYAANYRSFIGELVDIDVAFMDTFSEKSEFKFMVFHPSWGYLARSYGLQQIPIEIEGKDPKPAQLQKLIRMAQKEKIDAIFVQPQFSTKSAKQIAKEVGAQVIYADPLAEDWMSNIQLVVEKFKAALK